MRSPQIAIVGTTASGKSALAMALASTQPDVEIVCVDAMQVYRRMDIGTAKPTKQDQLLVPHHLLDLVEPSVSFSVTDFQTAANVATTDIVRRDRIALLVAGTGLYLKSLTDHFDPPGRWPDIRAALEAEAAAGEGPGPLYSRLQRLDPAAATKMEPTNGRRIIRALEVCIGSGRPFSSYVPGVDAYPPSTITQVGIRWPRAALTERISARVQAMVADGLVAEVQALAAEPAGLSPTARQALGYKEIIDHLEGRASLEKAISLIVQRTRQFAVRQDRWFRRDPRIRWIELVESPLEAFPLLRSLM